MESTARSALAVEQVLRQVGGDDIDAVLIEVGRVPEDDRFVREEQSEENIARLRVRLVDDGMRAGELIRRAAPAVAAHRRQVSATAPVMSCRECMLSLLSHAGDGAM